MGKERSIWLLIAVSVFLFAATTLAHNLIYFKQYCYPAFDLGIYMEALQKFGWKNWNPFLSTLGVGFLNDHWHPALLLAKPFTLIFSTSTSLFLVEIFFVVATALVPFYLVKKGLLRFDLAGLICMYLILNQREFEAAMAFPVHPAVWANFLLLLATALIVREGSDRVVFLLVFAAGFFGEQFSLSLLGYSLGLVIQKKRLGLIGLVFSAGWVWFSLFGRGIFVGPILHQTDRIALNIHDFFGKYPWNISQLKNVFKFVIEALPLLFVISKSKSSFDKPSGVLIAGIFLPLILGRLLSGSFGHQYDTLWITAIGALALLVLSSSKLTLSPGFLAGACVFFCVMSYSKFERAYGVVTESRLPNCIHSRDIKNVVLSRNQDLAQAFQEGGASSPQTIFALGNLVPNLVESFPKAEVVSLGVQPPDGSIPDWIITERGACGDPWPFDQASLKSKQESLLAQFPQLSKVKESPCLFSAHK
jgi:uncharacterized membrane protein